MPAAAGQLSVHTMASCYSCCAHSFLGPIVPFVFVISSARFFGVIPGTVGSPKSELQGIVGAGLCYRLNALRYRPINGIVALKIISLLISFFCQVGRVRKNCIYAVAKT